MTPVLPQRATPIKKLSTGDQYLYDHRWWMVGTGTVALSLGVFGTAAHSNGDDLRMNIGMAYMIGAIMIGLGIHAFTLGD